LIFWEDFIRVFVVVIIVMNARLASRRKGSFVILKRTVRVLRTGRRVGQNRIMLRLWCDVYYTSERIESNVI
jgi:hypothetical protein